MGGDGVPGRRPLAVVLLAALAALAGCAGVGAVGYDDGADDRLGWVDGYAHDDPLPVTRADGLNESERRAVVARTAARVELLRGLEFTDPVPVEVISRETYREERAAGTGRSTNEWREQVWEAPLLVGEDRTVREAFDTVYGTSVRGYYAPGDDRIVIVSDSARPSLDTRTLAHELLHALQDQRPELSLGGGADTIDEGLAADGLVEGDANAVEAAYADRCGSRWSCLPRPVASAVGGSSDPFATGVFMTVYAPYAEGPALIAHLRAAGGWQRVNAAYDSFPESSEQVIHPERYGTDPPTEPTVRDRTRRGWDRFDRPQTTETLGEATLYATLWVNGAIDATDRSQFDYAHPLSTGWDGDTVVPYTNGSHAGYVWKLAFDSPADAREFAGAYRGILVARAARSPDDGVYLLADGPFADAFRVRRSGATVVVVNAPTVRALDRVHAPA
jgi:hypothetical protein